MPRDPAAIGLSRSRCACENRGLAVACEVLVSPAMTPRTLRALARARLVQFVAIGAAIFARRPRRKTTAGSRSPRPSSRPSTPPRPRARRLARSPPKAAEVTGASSRTGAVSARACGSDSIGTIRSSSSASSRRCCCSPRTSAARPASRRRAELRAAYARDRRATAQPPRYHLMHVFASRRDGLPAATASTPSRSPPPASRSRCRARPRDPDELRPRRTAPASPMQSSQLAPAATYSEPIASAFGWHRVRVVEQLPGRIKPFEEVASAIALRVCAAPPRGHRAAVPRRPRAPLRGRRRRHRGRPLRAAAAHRAPRSPLGRRLMRTAILRVVLAARRAGSRARPAHGLRRAHRDHARPRAVHDAQQRAGDRRRARRRGAVHARGHPTPALARPAPTRSPARVLTVARHGHDRQRQRSSDVTLARRHRRSTLAHTARSRRWTIPGAPDDGALAIARRYIALGIDHIATGADHLLFLLALVLCLRTLRAVMLAETAFTLSHTLSFSASALGWVARVVDRRGGVHRGQPRAGRARRRQVGARHDRGRHAPGSRSRSAWCTASGFAGGLREIGLPAQECRRRSPDSRRGVELGQVVFLAIARDRVRARPRGSRGSPARRCASARTPSAASAASGCSSASRRCRPSNPRRRDDSPYRSPRPRAPRSPLACRRAARTNSEPSAGPDAATSTVALPTVVSAGARQISDFNALKNPYFGDLHAHTSVLVRRVLVRHADDADATRTRSRRACRSRLPARCPAVR